MSEPSAYHHGSLHDSALSLAVAALRGGATTLPPLRDLAGQLGVTHRALYRHFADKQALEIAVTAVGFDLLAAAMTQTADGGEPTARSVMRAYAAFALDEPCLYRLMFARMAGSLMQEPMPGPQVRAVIEIATRAFAAPGYDPQQVRDRVISAWGMAHGLCELWTAGVLRATTAERAAVFILERLDTSGLL